MQHEKYRTALLTARQYHTMLTAIVSETRQTTNLQRAENETNPSHLNAVSLCFQKHIIMAQNKLNSLKMVTYDFSRYLPQFPRQCLCFFISSRPQRYSASTSVHKSATRPPRVRNNDINGALPTFIAASTLLKHKHIGMSPNH